MDAPRPSPAAAPAPSADAATPALSPEAARPDRGHLARLRLMHEGARIFAEKGFDAASTREICLAAQSNVAAIHYHFGDKAGLYRAILWASIERVVARFPKFDPQARRQPRLEVALATLLRALIEPMRECADDPAAQWYARIHLRETLEPTPLMEDVIAGGVVPYYQQVLAILSHHCRVDAPDDELNRLAFAIVAMVNDYCMSDHWIRVLAPALIAGEDAFERTIHSLTGYACALVRYETQRRRTAQRQLTRPTAAPQRAKDGLRP